MDFIRKERMPRTGLPCVPCMARAQGTPGPGQFLRTGGDRTRRGLRDTHGAASPGLRGGGGWALLHVSSSEAGHALQKPLHVTAKVGKEPKARSFGAGGSVTGRAEAGAEVACPQELGRLARALTRAAPRQHWRELRTPPRGEGLGKRAGLGEAGTRVFTPRCAAPRCPGARPPGSGPRPAGRALAPTEASSWS